MGAEAIQQHQGNQSQISKGAKAAPELGHLVGGERHNHPPWLPEPKTSGNDTMGSSVTERRSPEIGMLEVVRPCGQWMSGMEAIERAEHAEAMVDGLRSRFGFCIELIADIIEQSRFIHLQQGPRRACQPPPCKVQQIVSVSTQGAERKLAQALGIEKGIGPRDFPPLVVDEAIGRSAGGSGGPMDQKELHKPCAWCKQLRKSAAVAPAIK